MKTNLNNHASHNIYAIDLIRKARKEEERAERIAVVLILVWVILLYGFMTRMDSFGM